MAKQIAILAPIIENERAAATYSEAIKPFRIEIEVLADDCAISFHQNRSVIIDAKTTIIGGPIESTTRSQVMEKIVAINDPILLEKVTISVEGLIVALNALHQIWYAEDKAAKAAALPK